MNPFARVGLGIATGGLSEVARPVIGLAQQGASSVSTAQTQEDRKRAIDFYNQMNAERAGATASVPTVQGQTVAAPTIDDTQAQQVRAQQLQHLQALQAAAAGQAPSVAQLQYQGAQRDIAAQQMGMAGQARGTAAVAARRDAMMNIGQGQQRAALDTAMLRAQEMAQARGQLGGALEGVRGADTSMAQFGAGQQMQAGLASAQLQQQAGLANAQNELQRQQVLNSYRLGLGSQALQSQGLGQQATAQQLATDTANKQRALQLFGAILGGATTAGMGIATGGGSVAARGAGGGGGYGTPNFNGGGDAAATPGWA